MRQQITYSKIIRNIVSITIECPKAPRSSCPYYAGCGRSNCRFCGVGQTLSSNLLHSCLLSNILNNLYLWELINTIK